MSGQVIYVKWDKSFAVMQGEGDLLAQQVAAWITEFYGERCPDFNEHCECCRRWNLFDQLFSHP